MTNDRSSFGLSRVRRAGGALSRADLVARCRDFLGLVPGDLRDLDAAAARDCSCHPRAAQDLHGGHPCPCQLTQAETHELATNLKARLAELALKLRPQLQERRTQLAAAAADLGSTAREDSPFTPWVIVGEFDGRRYYLRERDEVYAIAVAPDDEPELDPWAASRHTPMLTLRTGSREELLADDRPDYSRVAQLIATTVRTHTRQTTCPHPHQAGDRYCPACGTPLVDPAR